MLFTGQQQIFTKKLEICIYLCTEKRQNIYDKCQKILKPRSDAQNTFGLPKYTLKKDMKQVHFTFKLVHSHLEKKLASFQKEVEK